MSAKLIKNKYSLIIFDWDGTLMDSTGRIVSAMRAAAIIADLPIPTESQVKSIIGLSMQAVVAQLFPKISSQQEQHLLQAYRHQYIDVDKTPSPLFAGALEHIDWIKTLGIQVAVATGKARAGLSRVLTEAALNDYFHHTICADEAESKPHPQMVHTLINKARSTPHNTLVVGDSVHDLRMANNAQVDSLAVSSGANSHEELLPLKPLDVLDDISQIRQWLSQ